MNTGTQNTRWRTPVTEEPEVVGFTGAEVVVVVPEEPVVVVEVVVVEVEVAEVEVAAVEVAAVEVVGVGISAQPSTEDIEFASVAPITACTSILG